MPTRSLKQARPNEANQAGCCSCMKRLAPGQQQGKHTMPRFVDLDKYCKGRAQLDQEDAAYHAAHDAAYNRLKQLGTLNIYKGEYYEDMRHPEAADILLDDRAALDAAVMVVWRLLKDDYPVADRQAIVDAMTL